MKNIVTLFAFLCCLAVLAVPASADTLTLVSDSGVVSGGEVVYPYNFEINQTSSLTSLMCLDFDRVVTVGESWHVTAGSVPLDSSTLSTSLRADAWLFSQLSSGIYTNSDIQFAVWSILDADAEKSSGFDATARQLATNARTEASDPALLASGFFSGFTLYQPTADQTGWTSGIPQDFLGTAQTPEPSSLILLGSGLAGCVGAVRKRLRA